MKKVPILTAGDLGSQSFLLDEALTYVVKTEDTSIQKTPTGLLVPDTTGSLIANTTDFLAVPFGSTVLDYNGMHIEVIEVEGIQLVLSALSPFTAKYFTDNGVAYSTLTGVEHKANLYMYTNYYFTYFINGRDVILNLLKGKYGWHLEVVADFERAYPDVVDMDNKEVIEGLTYNHTLANFSMTVNGQLFFASKPDLLGEDLSIIPNTDFQIYVNSGGLMEIRSLMVGGDRTPIHVILSPSTEQRRYTTRFLDLYRGAKVLPNGDFEFILRPYEPRK